MAKNKKPLLNEGTVRRMMKLANMEALGNGFITEKYSPFRRSTMEPEGAPSRRMMSPKMMSLVIVGGQRKGYEDPTTGEKKAEDLQRARR